MITTMLPSDAAIAVRGGPRHSRTRERPGISISCSKRAQLARSTPECGKRSDTRPTRRSARFTSISPPRAASPTPIMAFQHCSRKTVTRKSPGGFFKIETDDFSSQVSAFKAANAVRLTGFMLEPHFATFWKQAAQSGYTPEVVTIAAAFLFPERCPCAWRPRRLDVDGSVVVAEAPIYVEHDRANCRRTGKGLGGRDGQAMDCRPWLCPRNLRIRRCWA